MGHDNDSLDLRAGLRAGHLIALLERIMRTEFGRALEPLGLTFQHFAQLLTLYNSGPISNAELARAAMITPQSANESVKQMLDRGWISRQQDSAHKRKLLISITPEGIRILEQADLQARRIEERMMQNQSDDERAQFLKLLSGAIAGLGETAVALESNGPRMVGETKKDG